MPVLRIVRRQEDSPALELLRGSLSTSAGFGASSGNDLVSFHGFVFHCGGNIRRLGQQPDLSPPDVTWYQPRRPALLTHNIMYYIQYYHPFRMCLKIYYVKCKVCKIDVLA